ncbi:MAG: sigma-70 family RNA polymerase sigma factor [Bacteroidota bacterium]|nr:sigma-70 family RNA polymerase sigma factor [Bacteroidota bacterium]
MKQAYKNIHEDLIEACKVYDRNAQNRIYKLYYRAMFNTSLRIVNNQVEAEDVMQESFLSAFEKIDQYSGTVSFGAWLKRIVINRSIDTVKNKKIQFEEIKDNLHNELISEEVEENNDKKQNIEKIKECVEKLANGYKIILSLYLFEGYDHEEIGAIMKISSSTSRSQFARAKKKLLELMNGN